MSKKDKITALKACGSIKWLENNVHNIEQDSTRFKEFFVAACKDVDKLIAILDKEQPTD